jgi:hypothetical protein
VSADPHPKQVFPIFHGEGAIMQADANRPQPAYLLESQRRVARIIAKQFVVPVRQTLNLLR